jgi:hypothetical protein
MAGVFEPGRFKSFVPILPLWKEVRRLEEEKQDEYD